MPRVLDKRGVLVAGPNFSGVSGGRYLVLKADAAFGALLPRAPEQNGCRRCVAVFGVDTPDAYYELGMKCCDNAECKTVFKRSTSEMPAFIFNARTDDMLALNLPATEDPTPLFFCAGCRNAQYCGPECQAADWLHGHKRLCGHLRTAWENEKVEARKAGGKKAGVVTLDADYRGLTEESGIQKVAVMYV